jgi:hypothetical protein
MMLVYKLPSTPAIYQRLQTGLSGSAYFIGGFGMTALTANDITVPIRSGVDLRLGANLGYLKFTPQSVLIRPSDVRAPVCQQSAFRSRENAR